ncbi:DUF6616 family protein [Candidatus Uabimicrobium sp. HlEnr_7]|uniref:DUF6616 family protein n=1 Tax=Candidatus Uabimicrobium helgolandensis TaxID=3095367 RepID=UPI003558C1A2
MKLFIELCNAKQSWLKLDEEKRKKFLAPVTNVMENLEASGAKIVAWGFNEVSTPQRAEYDFFAAIIFPDEPSALTYEQLFRKAGWYNYFEQVNVIGEMESYNLVLDRLCNL